MTALTETDLAAFHAARPKLFGIAYRILDSTVDADDVVQDAWIRWQGTDRAQVRDATAFLATTARRLAINVTQSARARHETNVGTWLSEPADIRADPALDAERAEALDAAVRTLLERLSSSERAAYVLREAFEYPYKRIAQVLATSEENARQLVTRARGHLADGRRSAFTDAERRRLRDALAAAARTGDLARLERTLTGGRAHDARVPLAIAA